jgi:hypothetical protein
VARGREGRTAAAAALHPPPGSVWAGADDWHWEVQHALRRVVGRRRWRRRVRCAPAGWGWVAGRQAARTGLNLI